MLEWKLLTADIVTFSNKTPDIGGTKFRFFPQVSDLVRENPLKQYFESRRHVEACGSTAVKHNNTAGYMLLNNNKNRKDLDLINRFHTGFRGTGIEWLICDM